MDPAREFLSLPDVPTRAIVSLLPLQQLITSFPRVHPRFSPIRASVLRVNQRLKLHIGDPVENERLKEWWPVCLPFAGHLVENSTGALLYANTYPGDFYRLHMHTLDSDSVVQLSTHMPAIAHLEVCFANADLATLSQLTILLAHWAPTLRTFKLFLGFSYFEKEWAWQPWRLPAFRLLLNSLNNLKTLEHLTLAIQTFGSIPNEEAECEPKVDLSFIGRFREFNFFSGESPSTQAFILEALVRYATEKLTHIGLPSVRFMRMRNTDNHIDLPAYGGHQLAARFTHIPFDNFLPLSHATVICRSFPNLRECSFNCANLSSDNVMAGFRALSTLSNLQFLHFDSFPLDLPNLVANFAQMSPLKSLKVLLIEFKTCDGNSKQGHDRLVAPYWAHLFPGVQIVRVVHKGRFCGACYPDEGEKAREIITDYAQVRPCLAQLLAPLKVLPSLRKIFYKRTRLTDCTAEFTAEGAFLRTHEYVI